MVLKIGLILIIALFSLNNSWGMLIEKCFDRNFVATTAEYIVEGRVERVESKWNKEKDTIFSYIDFKIDKYIKGKQLPENKVKFVIRSGCVEGVCSAVEDQPEPATFQKGKEIRLYLENIKGEFKLVCSFLGAEEIRATDLISKIEKARIEGRVNDKDAFMLKARVLFAPETIDPSSEFALKPGEVLQKEECGTGFSKELHRIYPQLTHKDKELLKSWNEDCRVIIETREHEELMSQTKEAGKP